MVVAVTGTVVQHRGTGAVRQARPKSDASIRRIPVPEFAAAVLRRRLDGVPPERTIFATRTGGPLSPYNPRRTFREFLVGAGLADSGISLRWYRRTGATVVARGLGSDAAAALLGHTSTAITEGHYIERDKTVDLTPAAQLERTLRPLSPDGTLLWLSGSGRGRGDPRSDRWRFRSGVGHSRRNGSPLRVRGKRHRTSQEGMRRHCVPLPHHRHEE